MARRIKHINVGLINDEPGWVLTYTDGEEQAVHLPIEVARQFSMGLQETVIQAERLQRTTGQVDHLSVKESVDIRLEGGEHGA